MKYTVTIDGVELPAAAEVKVTVAEYWCVRLNSQARERYACFEDDDGTASYYWGPLDHSTTHDVTNSGIVWFATESEAFEWIEDEDIDDDCQLHYETGHPLTLFERKPLCTA